jgi:hypothetical protein
MVHASRDTVGSSFVKIDVAYAMEFISRFDIEIAALKVRRLGSAALKQDEDGKPRFHFGEGNELFLVKSEAGSGGPSRIIRLHASILGNYFEWTEGGKLRFGHPVRNPRDGDPMSYKASDLIRFCDQVPDEMQYCLIRFIANLPDLDDGHRERFLALLKA